MREPSRTVVMSDEPSRDAPRVRRCLRCNSDFPSAWNGERICKRCKGTRAWRDGVSLSVSPSGRHRS